MLGIKSNTDLYRVVATATDCPHYATHPRDLADALQIFTKAVPHANGAGRLKVMAEAEYRRVYGGAL